MPATDATGRRVAVVVVPGVGDDAPGETLDAVAAALVSRIELQDGERRELMLSPAGNEVGYRSPWTRLHSPDRALEVDVYEMRWADISRFPGGVLRLVYTLYALLLQISTLGLEALRPLRGFMRRARIARGALITAAWLLAIPVLAVTAAVVLESGAVLGAVAFDDSPILARVVAVTVALVSVGFAAWGAHRLRRGGWQGLPPAVAVLVALLLIADAAWWVNQDGLRVGLANALVWVVAYPFRIAWLAASGAAAVAAVAVALTAFRRDGGFLRLGPERRRASLTGLITLAVAPLGIALVSATLFAAYGALALQVADNSSWGGTSELQCLATPSSWSLTPCDEVVLEPSEASDLGLPQGATVAEGSPADWAFALFSRGLGPLAPALLVAGILLGLLIIVAVLPFLLAIGTSRIEARRDRRAASERQGALMSSALDVAGNSLTGLLALAAVLAGAAAVYATWLAAGAPGSTTAARLGGAIALVVSALIILVRFLGVSPRRPLGNNASALERLRIVLDIPYDVATYLRVSQPGLVAPRERMLRRYRALLGEVAAGGVDRRPYDALVIVSHSQGTVLSAATLFGDLHRSPVARPLEDEEPGMVLPPRVSLLTCGCPLRQLYGERFPGQYDWVGELPLRPGGLRPLTGTWVNLYRSGDYVGRALWARDPDAPDVYDPEAEGYDLRAPGNPRVVERCVGAGSHTGYWSDATLGDWVMRLVVEG